ncbi:hypothetical protein JXM83_01625 [Candidatus Woesearchaeota archaeon]|nr:hypothetical protein [Candidatus Woesearchaeota archaeon]
MAGKVVAKLGVERESGFLYFIDKSGDVARAPMKRGNSKANGKKQVVAKAGVTRKKGFMYYLDKSGNVCEVSMNRKGGKKKKKADLAKPTEKFLVYTVEKKDKKEVKKVFKSKKIVLASKVKGIAVSKPAALKVGKKSVYGVKITYMAKIGKTYKKAEKVVSVTKPASDVRVVNAVPKKYQ